MLRSSVLILLAVVLAAGESALLDRLRPHLMLGVIPSPGSSWMDETIAQGARWDVRYMYLPGNVNAPGDSGWLDGDAAARRHTQFFLDDSARWNAIPCFTWYKICYARPGIPAATGGDIWLHEARQVKANLANAQTMRAYLDAIASLMRICGLHKGPVIFHHEPDMWGFLAASPVFAPNRVEQTYVAVAASGQPDLAGLPDHAGGLGQAIVRLRDRYAPNVILGWHASFWGNFDAKACAATLAACGKWDMVFTDPSDRDSGFKVARNYFPQEAWWDASLFERFRKRTAELHQATGLPLAMWQIPLGNTMMAACNDSNEHYQDNRVQHLLGGFPQDGNLQAWREAGVIMLLFGAGAAGATSFEDDAKDGVTNPKPATGNAGGIATVADDDGGYLRSCAIRYYQQPLPLQPPVVKASRAVRAKPAPRPVTAAAVPPQPVASAIARWDAVLRERLAASLSARGEPPFAYHLGSAPLPARVTAMSPEGTLQVALGAGGDLSVPWAQLKLADRHGLALAIRHKSEALDAALCAFYALATGQDAQQALASAGALAAEVRAAFPTNGAQP